MSIEKTSIVVYYNIDKGTEKRTYMRRFEIMNREERTILESMVFTYLVGEMEMNPIPARKLKI